jgi:triphosphoribosyl-dephospho-CoA synthetase
MKQAQPWWQAARAGHVLDADPAWSAWDEALKARAINPGTCADLSVGTALLAHLLDDGDNSSGST